MRTSGIPFQRTGIAGFTLLELIIALVILSTMLMLLFNGLRLGARAWDTVEERTTALQDAHLGQLLIRRQLEQAHALTLEGEDGEKRITFFGDSRSVRFVTPLPAHVGVGGLHWFTVQVVEGADAKQLVLDYALFQTKNWERYEDARAPRLVLYDTLAAASFAYMQVSANGRPKWTSRWDDSKQLPRLVRLRFRLISDDERWQELVVAPKRATHERRKDKRVRRPKRTSRARTYHHG